MSTKYKTKFLRSFLKENKDRKFTETVLQNFNPSEFKNLSPLEKYNAYSNRLGNINIYTKCTEKSLYFNSTLTKIARCGKNYYLINEKIFSIYIADNKITLRFGNYNPYSVDLLKKFFKFYNIKLWDDLNYGQMHLILKHSSLIKGIITGKIYNEETFYRRIASSLYKVTKIDWKAFKTVFDYYQTHQFNFNSFNDIRDFTTSFDSSIRVLADCIKNNKSKMKIIYDTIKSAIILNEKINLMWSEKRLLDEHLKQQEKIRMGEIEKTSIAKIHINYPEKPDIKLINTERDIFTESLKMHHCIYNCYSTKICNKHYVAYHIIDDDKQNFTLGLRKIRNIVEIDQLYGVYDTVASNSAIKKANQFVENHQEELLNLFCKSDEIKLEIEGGEVLLEDLF